MALDYTYIQATTQDVFESTAEDNVFNATPLLQKMRTVMDKSQDGGLTIKQPIIYARKNSTGWYDGFDTLLTTWNQDITAVEYSWGHAYATVSVAYTDTLSNSGKSQVVNLITTEVEVAQRTLGYTITAELFAETSTSSKMYGLPYMCATTTDFGGISSSDTSVWTASVDSSSTTMTMGLLQGKYGDCTNGNDRPDLIVSNQDNFDKYWQLLEVKPEFRVQGKNGSLMFNGAEWIVDAASNGTGSGTADNHVYFLNTKYIKFYVHPRDNFKLGEWRKPINQQVMLAYATATCALGTSNRRAHGVLTTINPAL